MSKMSGCLMQRRKKVEAQLHSWYPNLDILVHYTGAHNKMKFCCKRCGTVFEQDAQKFMYKRYRTKYGCPKCNLQYRVSGTVLPLKDVLKRIHDRFPEIMYVSGYTAFSKSAVFKCMKCGKTFKRVPQRFMKSRAGCPYCVHKVWCENLRKSPEQYQKEFNAKFSNLTLLTPYVNSQTRVKVKCDVCGNVWMAAPNSLLNMKFGCRVCANRYRGVDDRKSQQEFWHDLNNINPSILPLELYQGNKVRIKVKCKVCGFCWNARPNDLLTGHGGCKKCGIAKNAYSRASFSKAYQKVRIKRPDESYQHYLQNAYAYVFYKKHHSAQLLSVFTGINQKNKVRCLKCGRTRKVSAVALLNGSPVCLVCDKANGHVSKGEQMIASLLTQAGISYQYPYVSDGLIDRYPLHYDFRVNGKYLIEYQGEQHYRPVDMYGGLTQYHNQIRHDCMKRQWAKKNGFVLIEIKYSDSVKKKLGQYFPKVLNYEPIIQNVRVHRAKRINVSTYLNKELLSEFESFTENISFGNLMNEILLYMKMYNLKLVRPEYHRTKDSKVKSALLSEESYDVYREYRDCFVSDSEELRALLHSYYLVMKSNQ